MGDVRIKAVRLFKIAREERIKQASGDEKIV